MRQPEITDKPEPVIGLGHILPSPRVQSHIADAARRACESVVTEIQTVDVSSSVDVDCNAVTAATHDTQSRPAIQGARIGAFVGNPWQPTVLLAKEAQ